MENNISEYKIRRTALLLLLLLLLLSSLTSSLAPSPSSEFKEGEWSGMDTFLEWVIVVVRGWFTSGHRAVGGQEEDSNNHGRTKWRTSREAETWKKLWHKIDLWLKEWIDGSYMYTQILILIILIIITIILIMMSVSLIELSACLTTNQGVVSSISGNFAILKVD